jgi:hypothetical protein
MLCRPRHVALSITALLRSRRTEVSPSRLLPLLLLPLLAACSDDRVSYEIDGPQHTLTLIRQQQFPWDRKASYEVVAMRMPECMRRHKMDVAGMEVPVEVFSPGNNAWILRQGRRLYVLETRSCEGFARLEREPEDGLGRQLGTFRSSAGVFAFVPAPAAPAAAAATAPTVAPPAEPPVSPPPASQ